MTRGAYQMAEAALRLPMLLLTVAIIPVLAISASQNNLAESSRQTLATIDLIIWAAFAAEYVLLLALAPAKGRYLRTHLLELALVVLPFLRPLRLARSARVLRLATVLRLGAAGVRVTREARVRMVRSAASAALGTTVIIIALAGVAVLDLEQDATDSNIHTLPDALWWAVTTVTTVGYGDHFPVTSAGRGIAAMLMLVGIASLGIVTAAIAAWFVAASQGDQQDLRDEVARLSEAVNALAAAMRT
jgi:voltage-gated potassium channel